MRRAVRGLFLCAVAALATACGGGESEISAQPRVDLIPEAIAAVESYYGGPQEYFEISAGLDQIGFVVAVDGGTSAQQGSYSADGVFTAPQSVGPASGETFAAGEIDLDAERIFEELRSELDDPAIIDLAIQGGPGDTIVYDATIASESGGVILVLLGPDGSIKAVQSR